MKNNILFVGFLLVSSFSFSQVSSAKKLPESKEIKEEVIKIEPENSNALPSTKAIPPQKNTEQPLIEEKNNTPAQTGRKKL